MLRKALTVCSLIVVPLLAASSAALADDLTRRAVSSAPRSRRALRRRRLRSGHPEGANIPQFVTIDLGAKLVSTTPASGENRSTPLESVRREGA